MKNESGRSMIEMLGVLAIMGVITIGAIGMISTAMRTQKRSAVNDEAGRFFGMERAKPLGRTRGAVLQIHVFAYNVFNIVSGAQLGDKIVAETHGASSFS